MTITRMLRMLTGLFGIRVAGAALNLISQIVFTRIFIPSDVGVIFLAMSSAAFFGQICGLGYPSLALTQLPRFATLGFKRIQRAFHAAFLRDATIIFLVLISVVSLSSLFFNIDDNTRSALLFASLAAPASIILRYDSSVASSARRFSLSYIPDFIGRPILLLAYVLAIVAASGSISVIHCLTAFVVVLYIISIGQAMLLGPPGVQVSDILHQRAKLTRTLRPRAIALGIAAAVATTMADIVIMISGFLLPADELAILAVTLKVAALTGFVIQVTQQFVLPDLIAAVTKHDAGQTNDILLRLNLLTLLTIIFAMICTALFGHWALAMFGASYQTGSALLVALMFGQSIRALSGMNQQLLAIAGYQGRTAAASLVALAFFVFGSILAARSLGMMGVGYAVIVAELAWAVMLAVQAQSLINRRGDIFWLLQNSPAAKTL